jgi:hypothetical protein
MKNIFDEINSEIDNIISEQFSVGTMLPIVPLEDRGDRDSSIASEFKERDYAKEVEETISTINGDEINKLSPPSDVSKYEGKRMTVDLFKNVNQNVNDKELILTANYVKSICKSYTNKFINLVPIEKLEHVYNIGGSEYNEDVILGYKKLFDDLYSNPNSFYPVKYNSRIFFVLRNDTDMIHVEFLDDSARRNALYYVTWLSMFNDLKSKQFLNYLSSIKNFQSSINVSITNPNEENIDDIMKESRDISPEIEDVIKLLNDKGYKTIASSPGYEKYRNKRDLYKDGIKYDSLYTTARVVFEEDYDISPPPGWEKRKFDGKIGIYPKPRRYRYKDGVPDKAFEEWKNDYMATLRGWADELKSIN